MHPMVCEEAKILVSDEAQIVINGVALRMEQSHVVRIALEQLYNDLDCLGLGESEQHHRIQAHYMARIREIGAIIMQGTL